MNFYIADLHFGHKNVLKHDSRPFENVEEMDRALINNWNSVVRDEDDVYILGDFTFRSDKEPSWYLKQLKGRKHLIVGNHDGKLLSNEEALSYFTSIQPMLSIKDGKYKLVLCHYPLAEWDGYFRETWHVYGHIHSMKHESYEYMSKQERAVNAGCMINDYKPVSIEELIKNNQDFKERKENK